MSANIIGTVMMQASEQMLCPLAELWRCYPNWYHAGVGAGAARIKQLCDMIESNTDSPYGTYL